MKLDLKKFNDADIQTMSAKTTKMRLSEDAHQVIFQMFTKNVYSNPIGSIVREITSNSVDSHVEAGVNDPVIVKLTHEESGSYISFVDVGVGMNPERIDNVYGVYFESTKRNNNNEIGGFGIGGKTPMAYADSFFVITVADKKDDLEYTAKKLKELQDVISTINVSKNEKEVDGLISTYGEIEDINKDIERLENRIKFISEFKSPRIKYHYCIYKGENAPMIQELGFEETTDRKGSEVKVPVKGHDVNTFRSEIKKQLYYFENIVFEGWGDGEFEDEYTLFKGEHFIFRGKSYDDMHLCLGNVAYPIDFSALDLSRYDYQIPIALKFNIGDLNVTASRESLDYSEKTKKVIIEKIKLVKEEIQKIYNKQIEHIVELDEYLAYREHKNYLKLGDSSFGVSGFIDTKVLPVNFKYSELPTIPQNNNMFSLVYNVHRIGKKQRHNTYIGSYDGLMNNNNKIFHVKGYAFKKNNHKTAYLREQFGETVYVLTKKHFDVDDEFEMLYRGCGVVKYDRYDGKLTDWFMDEKKAKNLVKKFIKDLWAIAEKNTEDFNFTVPEDFVEARKTKMRKKRQGITVLNVRDHENWNTHMEIKSTELENYRGKIFYGFREDEDKIGKCINIHKKVFGGKHLLQPYRDFSSKCINNNGKKKGTMIIQVRKNEVKYYERLPNAYHVNNYIQIMLSRKYEQIENHFKYTKLKTFLDEVPELFHHPDFGRVSKKIVVAIEKIETEMEIYENNKINNCFDYWSGLTTQDVEVYLKINTNSDRINNFTSKKYIDLLTDTKQKNVETLKYFCIPNRDSMPDKLVSLLRLALEI
jgi:hypothetical protein